jgi:hypothetical protein
MTSGRCNDLNRGIQCVTKEKFGPGINKRDSASFYPLREVKIFSFEGSDLLIV